MFKTKTFRGWLAVLTAASLLVFHAGIVKATLPISGNTLDFGVDNEVGGQATRVSTLAVGDLDQDGDGDLVSGNDGNEITVWQNDESPFSGAWTQNAVGTGMTSILKVAVGDLDNDGDIDIVTGSGTSAVGFELKVWQNDGSPFSGAWTVTDAADTASSVITLALGDLDTDGDLDIVTGQFGGAADAWLNDGTPFTGAWTSNSIGASTDDIKTAALGDLDNDGDLDLVTGTDDPAEDFEVIAWKNDGTPFTGTWTQTDVGATPSSAQTTALLGDLDDDGDLDIVTAGVLNVVNLWENDGSPFSSGTWTPNSLGTIFGGVLVAAMGDLDGDGVLDAVTGRQYPIEFDIFGWQNDGTPFSGTWDQTDVGGTVDNGYAMELGDLDGDGDLDVVTASILSGDSQIIAWENTHVHRNTPFSDAGIDLGASADDVFATAAGDLNGDGDIDLVTVAGSAEDFEVIAWKNDGRPFAGGTWAPTDVGTSFPPADVLSVALGDLDRDGDLDIVTGSSVNDDWEVIAWQSDGTPFNGGWTQTDVGSLLNSVQAVAVADLDRDGDLDIVSGSGTGAISTVYAWENDATPFGGGAWSFDEVGNTTDAVNTLAIGDLNNDGDPDVVAGTGSAENFELIAWESDGSPFSGGGTWAQTDVGASSDTVNSVALGDLNRDGDLDIVSGSGTGEDFELIAWKNDGTPFAGGAWAPTDIGASAGHVNSVALGDLDADGDLDLVSGSNWPAVFEIAAWRNDGTPFIGAWLEKDLGTSADSVNSVVLADFNLDGDLDAASAGGAAEDFELIAWKNIAGSARLVVTNTAAGLTLGNGVEEDLLQVDFSHTGLTSDALLKLSTLDLTFTRDDCITALTTTEASAILSNVRVRLDDGDGLFETTDTLVHDTDILNLTSGVQTIYFSGSDPNVQVTVPDDKTFWISVVTATDASAQDPHAFCVSFDPDAATLVESESPDYSVSIEDTQATSTGAVPIARLAYLPVVFK